MTIEVKQLQITSTVTSDVDSSSGHPAGFFDIDSVREEILAECRQMIRDLLRAERER